jgi:hypothetical protein
MIYGIYANTTCWIIRVKHIIYDPDCNHDVRTTISAVKADIGGIGGHTRPSDQLIEAVNMPVCIHFLICSPISLMLLLLLSCSYHYWCFFIKRLSFPDQTPRFCPSFESLFLLHA